MEGTGAEQMTAALATGVDLARGESFTAPIARVLTIEMTVTRPVHCRFSDAGPPP